MPDVNELRELLARVEAATGADREIDIAIFTALLPFGGSRRWHHFGDAVEGSTGYLVETPRVVTHSIDATIGLVERLLPTALIDIHQNIGGYAWATTLTDGAYCVEGKATTLPVAILVALLRALIAKAEP